MNDFILDFANSIFYDKPQKLTQYVSIVKVNNDRKHRTTTKKCTEKTVEKGDKSTEQKQIKNKRQKKTTEKKTSENETIKRSAKNG